MGQSKLIELLQKQRRRIERVRVKWDALYGPEGSAPSLRCRVLDASIAGARLELVEDPGGQLDLIRVELDAPELGANGLTLRAEVRNVSSNKGRRVIGVEFYDTHNRTRLVLTDLIARHS